MKLWKFLILLGVLGAVAVVLVAGINFLVLPSLVHANKVVAVPDLRGASAQAAADLLRPLDLDLVVTRQSPHPSMRAGLIFEQVPAPQAGIRTGRSVKVVVSSGPAMSTAPDLAGLSRRQAEITLERERFQLGRVVTVRREGITEPQVEAQQPQPGLSLLRGTAIDVVVAEPAPRTALMMPDLRGRSLFQARQAISAAGMILARVSYDPLGGAGNEVMDQRPRAGTRISRGEAIELMVSSR